MAPTEGSNSPIVEAIALLQDALKKQAFDKKGARADVTKAANTLLASLGLPGVAPDPGGGQ